MVVIWFMTMMMLTRGDWRGRGRLPQDANENYGGEFSDDDNTCYSADYVDYDDTFYSADYADADADADDDADDDAGADASNDTYMPTQGLPPLAMTGSVAITKIKNLQASLEAMLVCKFDQFTEWVTDGGYM